MSSPPFDGFPPCARCSLLSTSPALFPPNRRCPSLKKFPRPPNYVIIRNTTLVLCNMPSRKWQIRSSLRGMSHPNSSEYSLHGDQSGTSLLATASTDDHAYGTMTSPHAQRNSSQLLFKAAVGMAVVFVLSTTILGTILWLALPPLEEYGLSH